MTRLSEDLEHWFTTARHRASRPAVEVHLQERGTVEHIGDGVATVSGLSRVRQDELVRIGADDVGLAVSLESEAFGCVLLTPGLGVVAGTSVRGTGEVARVPVGEDLLGRVIDPLGRPLDDGPAIVGERRDPIDAPAPGIVERALVDRPLQTGITVIDAMIPLGRGQRELIIGDRKTGRTAIAVDTMINQRDGDVICVYAAVGQKASSINRVVDAVRRHGAPGRCLFVIGLADAAPGLQWITPDAACTMAEFFSRQGRDALLIIDDLTQHAAIHRQISLLLRRPPGREAYPGDIFHVHARLLERSARLSPELGGGSLTALPMAETLEGNLAAYIPTNLISITDGQVYLEPKLFHEGRKPAVDVGRSVSRVGGKAQSPAIRALSGRLRLEYTQFMELEVFTRFGAMMDERTRKAVERGRRIRVLLTQPRFRPRSVCHQAALLLALDIGLLDTLPLEKVTRFREEVPDRLRELCPDVVHRVNATGELSDDDGRTLARHLTQLIAGMAKG